MYGKHRVRGIFVLLSVVTVMIVIMTFTGKWPTNDNPYQSYRLQAQAWLNGQLDLGKDYPWLELAIYKDKYFVSFPPFPSYVLVPFCLLFQNGNFEHWIMLFMMVIALNYAMELYRVLLKNDKNIEFYLLFLFLGNGYLFVALQGWVWFFAQSMCFTLSLMALAHAAKGQGGLSLTCWACAIGCRPMVAIYLPLIMYLILQNQKLRKEAVLTFLKSKWYWWVFPALILFSYLILNYMRFENAFEFGHNYLPEFTRIETGQFNLSYVEHNIFELLRLPERNENNGALHYPTFGGIAFWLTNPIIVTAVLSWVYSIVKEREGRLFTLFTIPIMFFAHLFILLCHKTLGGWQFGNRYLLDALPYIYVSILLWAPDKDIFVTVNLPLFCLGTTLNLIGTVATYNKWI